MAARHESTEDREATTAMEDAMEVEATADQHAPTSSDGEHEMYHDAHEYSFEIASDGYDEYAASESALSAHEDASSDTQDIHLRHKADPVARQRVQAMLNGVGPRVRSIMQQLKQRTDPSLHLIGLQDLAELLLVSTEDMLAGVLSLDRVAQELVFHLKGEDPVCGGNPEIMLLACRCIANLVEAIPGSASTLVCRDVVPVLCAKLQAIEYIDLAEQALSTLAPISAEYPSCILRDNGLLSVLMFIDFFTVNAQRTALTIAANCCRAARAEYWDTVKELLPTLERLLLEYTDQQIVETVCLCFSRLVNGLSQHRDHIEHMMSAKILQRFDDIIRATSTIKLSLARVSPKLAVELLRLNTMELVYQWLTGHMPPSSEEGATVQPLGMTETIGRSGDRVKHSLVLLSELLPPVAMDSLWPSSDAGESGMETTRSKKEMLEAYLSADDRQRIGRWMLPVLVEIYTITVKAEIRERILLILWQLRLDSRVSGLFDGTYRSTHDYAILIAHKSAKLLELMEEQKTFKSSASLISSVELLQSGMIEALSHYLTDTSISGRDGQCLEARHSQWISLFCEGERDEGKGKARESAATGSVFSLFVKRLHEALSRHDAFTVLTDYYAEDETDIPKAYVNLVVSIHAVVPFQIGK
ncbi:armadillo-type protein [Syncephalis pseudoplumigaleata]|uniref:HECT-type E3 ubiquitin transferase n=1 Tax=Syncephalis pseudoplumigaleata TaxID=1712513 RepID=A0A4P9YXY3_9FUNG|nr:armadillo-type protein [Syncephalis pseudoplumigaleata]|eukprot:RKP24894.1 armadillo-type protein [Syncephalis pseudoplumigaleata]